MLRWQHRWSKHLKVWQKLYDAGREVHPQFFEQPEIAAHLHDYYSAFGELSTERQIGMGVGPIPVSKIKSYATEELGLTGDEHERFCIVLRRVDDDYLSMSNSTEKQKSKRAEVTEVAATDAAGVRQLFNNLAAQKKSQAQKQQRQKAET